MSIKIGIGITTHNRPEVLKKTLINIWRYRPLNTHIVLIDDASTTRADSIDIVSEWLEEDENSYCFRFDSNVGIARAKNKALELLYNAGCEHFFLFDDDTYPLVDNWHEPYITSGEPHLMYIFQHFTSGKSPHDMIPYYSDGKITAYSHVRGCMLYYHRSVLDTVGGMDITFGKWGHEHGDLSNRIYAAGLTRFRYMDVANSKGMFYAADEQEHGKFKSTVPGAQRIDMLKKTQPIYEAHYNTPVYCEFRERGKGKADKGRAPLFLTAYFTTLPDPQRPGQKWEFDFNHSNDYRQSIYFHSDGADIKNIILNDADKDYENDTVCKWVPVKVSINPYFQRWISYYEYLIREKDNISWVFMTDCTDVELLKMPDPKPGTIYVGDEPDLIGKSQWLQYHHKHPVLQRFYVTHRQTQMVNAGILGGYIEDVLPFIRAIIDTYVQMSHDQHMKGVVGPGMTDMGVFNYVAHTQFTDKISHGKHVNTTFKANERNDVSWFKHK